MNDPEPDASKLLEVLGQIGLHNHLALIYETREEQFAAAIPAIRIGIERREKCVYVADENTSDDVIDALRHEGIDVDAAVKSGSLIVATKRETTLKEGHLVPDKLIRFWADAADAATAAGFSGLRIVAEMTWALHRDPGTERLIEFEAKVNDLVRSHPIVGICQYNRRSFSPEDILNVIRVHPLVFIEGLVCRNPYYIPPQEFLAPHRAEREVERLLTNLREREQTEQALRESEARFRQLLASNIVGVNFWNLQGDIVDANDLFLNMLGYTREDLRQGNLSWKNITPPEYVPVDEKAVGELVATGTCAPFEKEYIRKNGSRVFVLIGSTLLDAQKQTGSSFVMDITERKEAERKIEHFAELFQMLSRHLLHIQEEERRHLARELHDEIGQVLTAAKLNLKIIAPDVPPAVAGRLEDSIQLLDRLLDQVRQLSLDLRPPLLDELGLVPAVRWLADQQAQRTGLRITFTANGEGLEMDSAARTACFRIAQEAITNAIRHAQAATVAIELRAEPDRVWLVVQDDGVGFDKDAMQQRAARGSSVGLLSMNERVALLGGELELNSAPGRGTEIRAWFPLARSGPDATP
jgi:PAS domain S-box-containing protein